MIRSVVILALLGSSSAIAATDDAGESWKAAKERFTNRMQLLESDTREVLEAQYERDRAELSKGYDELLTSIETNEKTTRTASMERFEAFLTKYPNTPYASHIRFRLADLFWEQASEEWLAAGAEYEVFSAQLETEGRLDELPPAPMMDLGRVEELYRAIVESNLLLPPEQRYEFLDGALYSLAFVYKEPNALQHDDGKARSTFEQLLTVAPDSELADDAHLNLGNFLFEENRYEESLVEYWQVYRKGMEARLYSDAMYQLAWAYYKLDVYDNPRPGDPPDAAALPLFGKLLLYSEQRFTDTGKRSEYAPDATKFMAFSFADMAEDTNRDPMEMATEWFAAQGESSRIYERPVYIALGELLVKYGRFDQAIRVYRKLQESPWENEPENPQFQMQVVKLLNSGADRNPEASAAARIELTERYNDKSIWWEQNRNNPDALAVARSFTEESLADVAIEYRKNADETGDIEQYRLAADKFREYLERFPISDDYFQIQWYLADTLYRGRDFKAAIPEYEALARTAANHPFGDGAVYQRLRAIQESAFELKGKPDVLPADAVVERTYTTPFGATLSVYALSQEHQTFIKAVDNTLSYSFHDAPTDGSQPDWKSLMKDNRAAFLYNEAQLLVTHNRYDEARPRLLAIVDTEPESIEASYAAGLLIDTYSAEGDLAQVREYAKRFATDPPGPSTTEALVRVEKFRDSEQRAAFAEAAALAERGDHLAAAETYLRFVQDYPNADEKIVQAALYNAAVSYDKLGNVERANTMYEDYVRRYPADPESAKLYIRMASNYEATFQLEKAIEYNEQFLKYFKNDPAAADALFNIAFLKVGLGDAQGAAKGFEEYARRYPEASDSEDVLFRAGEQYEQLGAAKSIGFYESYLKSYGMRNPEHGLTVIHRLAELYQKQGNSKKSEEYRSQLLKEYDGLTAAQKTDAVRDARRFVAETAFREIQASYDKLTKDKLSNNPQKDSALLERKVAEVDAFREQAREISTKYGDFERVTGAMYLSAASLLYRADLGFAIRPPPGLSEEDETAFMEVLEADVYPALYTLQEDAKKELSFLLEYAKKEKRHSKWVSEATQALNRLDPFAFPGEKPEARAPMTKTQSTTLKPVNSQGVLP